jgi:hypothetical protein
MNSNDIRKPEFLALLNELHNAMVAVDINRLDDMLEDDYSLVHITGYEQPKQEWFEVMIDHSFDYHNIRVNTDSLVLAISGSGNSAIVSGRGIFDATINGMHSPWRLDFTHECYYDGLEWRLVCSRYRSY